MEREGYGFSPEAKQQVHFRAGNNCEFPADPCPRKNNGIVHHISGVYESKMSGMTREVVHNPDLNAVMLCEPHAIQHDIQEAYQVANLEMTVGRPAFQRRHNRNTRHQRRRRR